VGALDADAPVLDVLRAEPDDFATPRRGLEREFQDQPLLCSEQPVRPVLRDLLISPGVVSLGFGQLDAGDKSLITRHCRW